MVHAPQCQFRHNQVVNGSLTRRWEHGLEGTLDICIHCGFEACLCNRIKTICQERVIVYEPTDDVAEHLQGGIVIEAPQAIQRGGDLMRCSNRPHVDYTIETIWSFHQEVKRNRTAHGIPDQMDFFELECIQ